MELFQLETFLAVAESRSFSRAAQKLHRTQPAVSQTIRKLESDIGEPLFDRSSRDANLTDAGRLLVDYAEKLLNLRSEAGSAITELRELHAGKLAIAANEFTAIYLLPVLEKFRHQSPMIKVAVQRSLSSQKRPSCACWRNSNRRLPSSWSTEKRSVAGSNTMTKKWCGSPAPMP